ncbi:MAG: leucine-rich repeat protein, partial [Intestinibacter sp.]
KILKSSEKTYSDLKNVKIVTDEGVRLTTADFTFLNTNFTALEKLDLSSAALPTSGLPANAFKDNATIKEVLFPKSLNILGTSAFENCTALEIVDIPSQIVNTIPKYCFKGCTNLKNIEIPVNVVSILQDAFSGCTSLNETIIVNSPRPANSYRNTNPFANTSVKTIVVPFGCADDYKNSTVWNNLEIVEAEELKLDIEVEKAGGLQEAAENAMEASNINGTKAYSLKVKCAEGVILNSDDVKYLKGHFGTALNIDISGVNFENDTLPEQIFISRNIKTLRIPDSIKVIAKGALKYCNKLTSINVPSNLQTIEDEAFYFDTVLTMDNLPESVTYIGKNAFWGCQALAFTALPSNLTSIEEGVFFNCNKLAITSIPENITKINDQAFTSCTSIGELKVSDKLEYIGYNAFASCTSLKMDNLPESVTYIADGAFGRCFLLEFTSLPSKITFIGEFTFAHCAKLAITSLPEDVTKIANYAFYNSGITELKIPEKVESIGEWAFAASKIQKIVLPEGLTTISNNIFSGCTSLESVNLPSTLTKIGDSAFSSCGKLVLNELPNGIQEIGNSAFSGCTSLESVNLPSTLTKIGDSVFSSCGKLVLNELPDSVEEIGSRAFYKCTNLGLNKLPANLKVIGTYAFAYSGMIKITTIPASVISIGSQAFRNCTSLPEILYVNAKVPPTITANTFTGSSVKAICVPEESVQAYKEDANWSKFIVGKEVNVTFDANNGEEKVVKTTVDGLALDYMPEAPAKEGYVFVGWYKDVDDITTAYENNATYDDDVTYTAKYAHVQMLGAQGKLVVNGKSGIRFGTKIFNDGDKIVEKGTLIIPSAILGDQKLTLDTPKAARSVGTQNYEKTPQYTTYLGTLVGIPESQFDTEITATAYVIYQDKAGNQYTVYSDYANGSTSVDKLIGNRIDWDNGWEY